MAIYHTFPKKGSKLYEDRFKKGSYRGYTSIKEARKYAIGKGNIVITDDYGKIVKKTTKRRPQDPFMNMFRFR